MRARSKILMVCAIGGVYAATGAAPARGQTSGSTAAALAGAALGLYSGALLAMFGSIIPCTETPSGAPCVRLGAAFGGTVGLVGGALTGAGDSERLQNTAISTAIGFGVGGIAGLALKPVAQRVAWRDVATMAVWGGAIGAQPMGSLIGFGVGGLVGFVFWQAVPGFNFPEALATAAAGVAIGGLVGWMEDGISAQTADPPTPVTLLRIRF